MIRLEQYTKEEEQAINELKRRTFHEFSPRLKQDETVFYRFLKARDFNINDAESMLLKHLSVRKLYQLDDILETYTIPERILKYFPDNFLGCDKEGSVVRYLDVGGADHKGVTYSIELRDVFRYIIYYSEQAFDLMTEHTKLTGKSVTQLVYIIDVKGLDLIKATHKRSIQNFVEVFQFMQDNCPERIKAIYVINASYYFYISFPIFKAILASSLLQKVRIYEKTGWKEALLEAIEPEVLPAFLGGKRTDPDGNPLCLTFIRRGVKVPENLYLNKSRKTLKNENGTKTVVVKQRSRTEVDVHVTQVNINIEWEFETKSKDIGFELLYKVDEKKNSEVEEVIPKHRVNTELGPETGFYKCDKIGTYLMVFDNSYSWLFSKEVYYRIRLTDSNTL